MAEAARYALAIRYSLLPYLYTSFRNTASHGCPLARPLMLGWPSDPAARTRDRQWTMGDAVLVTPVLDQARSCLCHPCLGAMLTSPYAARPLMLACPSSASAWTTDWQPIQAASLSATPMT